LRPIDIHVDQLRTSIEAGAAEGAQIARAQEVNRAALGGRDQAVATPALIAGAEAADVMVDQESRTLRVEAAELPGLGLEGYRVLEARAISALPGWSIEMLPPQTAAMPPVAIEQGVVDGLALDLAAWASSRLERVILVEGGTTAQRRAVAQGIIARGGRAGIGEATGRFTLDCRLSRRPRSTTEPDGRRA